jgi:hypothetical protein
VSDLAEFSRLAMTLEPWRTQIVFVGGWAFRLYGYEPRAYTVDHKPIFTQDADVAYNKQQARAARRRYQGGIGRGWLH